jgi:hypothetical protein
LRSPLKRINESEKNVKKNKKEEKKKIGKVERKNIVEEYK